MKAHGGGLSLGLRNIDVGVGPDEGQLAKVVLEHRTFWLCDLEIGEADVAAIALEAPISSIHMNILR